MVHFYFPYKKKKKKEKTMHVNHTLSTQSLPAAL